MTLATKTDAQRVIRAYQTGVAAVDVFTLEWKYIGTVECERGKMPVADPAQCKAYPHGWITQSDAARHAGGVQ